MRCFTPVINEVIYGFQPCPSPPLGQLLKRHFVRDALIASHATLGIHLLLIGGAIGTDIDNALPALREFSLTISNKLMLLFTNTLKQDACRLITRVLWNELSLNRHLQD